MGESPTACIFGMGWFLRLSALWASRLRAPLSIAGIGLTLGVSAVSYYGVERYCLRLKGWFTRSGADAIASSGSRAVWDTSRIPSVQT